MANSELISRVIKVDLNRNVTRRQIGGCADFLISLGFIRKTMVKSIGYLVDLFISKRIFFLNK